MIEKVNVRDVQLEILGILVKADEICKRNNIPYFLVGGTLLVAVRHKGFIPWDDDLDIGMTRENYNKFMQIAEKELPKNLFLQTYNTEPNSPFDFAKIRKDGTIFMENYCQKLDIHHGVYIDIFPYDNIPDDIKLRKRQHFKVQFWSNLFIAKTLTGSSVPQVSFVGKIKLLVRLMMHYLLKPIPKTFLFNNLEKNYKKYNNQKCKMRSMVKFPNFMISNEDLNNPEEIEFEGLLFPCPRDPKKQLERQYGDYMQLPPEEERVGHRPCKIKL